MDVEELLALQYRFIGAQVMPSKFVHPHEGLNKVAARTILKVKHTEGFYNLLIFTDLSEQILSTKEYDKGAAADLISKFLWWAKELSTKGTDRLGIGRSCWVQAASFCAMGYIRGARYLTQDTTPAHAMHLLPIRNNIFLAQWIICCRLWFHCLSSYHCGGRQEIVIGKSHS